MEVRLAPDLGIVGVVHHNSLMAWRLMVFVKVGEGSLYMDSVSFDSKWEVHYGMN
jgi:hypothetical protein